MRFKKNEIYNLIKNPLWVLCSNFKCKVKDCCHSKPHIMMYSCSFSCQRLNFKNKPKQTCTHSNLIKYFLKTKKITKKELFLHLL